MTILASSPINSIIALILTFCDAAFVLFNFGFDFLGLIFIIIYVGAIAVLFLFIIMMMNLKSVQQQNSFSKNEFKYKTLILFFIVIVTFLIKSCLGFINSYEYLFYNDLFSQAYNFIDNLTNIEMFGNYFYNFFNIYFLLAGVILLVALVGAIVLTIDASELKTKIFTQIELKQLAKSSNTLSFYTT